jgi:hypothetical protein
MTTSTTAVPGPLRTVAAPAGFLGAYLLTSPISDLLADRPLPLPTSTAVETAAYFAANPAAVAVSAGLQVLSVLCFAVFVRALAPMLHDTGRTRAWTLLGYGSVVAMVVSSALSGAAAVVASSAPVDAPVETVELLRQASFYAGGVGNVVLLGGFVFGAALVLGRSGALPRAVRGFGYVAGALAVLSVLSIGIYYATALLPVGRVLSMLWTVVAGIALARLRTRR